MADVTINALSLLTPVVGSMELPASTSIGSTGKVTIANINSLAPVQSVAARTGAVVLTKTDVGLNLVDNKSSVTIRSEITSSNVTTALGYTPVQQGGGTGQLTNKLFIGWSSANLLLQVDNTNFANVWPISVSGNAATASNGIKAWGIFDATRNATNTGASSIGDVWLKKSYNISRVSRITTGQFIVYFSTPSPVSDGNYAVSGTAAKMDQNNDGNIAFQAGGYYAGPGQVRANANTSAQFYVVTPVSSSNPLDSQYVSFMVVG